MKHKKAGILGGIALLLLIILFGLSSYYLYQNWPGEIEQFQMIGYGPDVDLEGVTGEVIQFYSNMRFNHNDITYYMNPECDEKKEERVEEAFSILHEKTEILSFETADEEDADILIGCSEESYEKEENLFVAGEGGPTKIVNSSLYPIILKGKVLLYDDKKYGKKSRCDYPVTELHEIIHVFGFDHINDSSKIMYPYVECDQRLGDDLIVSLVKLYSVEPLPELYFKNINATKSGRYLDFAASITNMGLVDAENVRLDIYEDDKLLNSFDIGDIEFGAGKIYSRTNFKLSSRASDKIEFRITCDNKEINEENNIKELETTSS